MSFSYKKNKSHVLYRDSGHMCTLCKCNLLWVWEGPWLRRGGSHPVMRYVRCFSNSGWTDPWSRVTALCPNVQQGSTLSCKRGQFSLHNKTIHLHNEVVFPGRERLASWMADSEGGGWGGGKGRWGVGSIEASDVIVLVVAPFVPYKGENLERSRNWNLSKTFHAGKFEPFFPRYCMYWDWTSKMY